MADRGKSIKKHRIKPMKIVTVGTINRSISIRAAETRYFVVMSAAAVVFILFSLPVESVIKGDRSILIVLPANERNGLNGLNLIL
jgi:hypothetical protein